VNYERLKWLYEAGDLKRLHALPTVRVHTMAEHVFGAQAVAVELFTSNPDADIGRVLGWLLYHDVPEVWTGDVPAHIKKLYPDIEEMLGEEEVAWKLENKIDAPILSDSDSRLAKAADRLDLAVCCLRERQYGNRHERNKEVFNRVLEYVEQEAVGVHGVHELAAVLRREWDDV
jgi:5'-deoxynucleotidase YfbR-like HD superfamily hydrolase